MTEAESRRDTAMHKPFTAVLLAGGRSTRMGTDKAMAKYRGEVLWERQMRTLRQLAPDEVLVSGRSDRPYARSSFRVIEDDIPGLGPLGGLATALRIARHEQVLILGIDLPEMDPAFLRRLLDQCERGKGIVPVRLGRFEPMAAVYPRKCAGLAAAHAQCADRSMRSFIEAAMVQGWLKTLETSSKDTALFQNMNSPSDLQ